MKTWHIKSHNILLSGDGENTNSLQFNGLWIKFEEEGQTLKVQAHKCSFTDTVTARGGQGKIRMGETVRSDRRIDKVGGVLKVSSNGASKHESLLTLGRVQGLFPRGVSNFNNLIYNIRSYNKAHFEDGENYYNTRNSYGRSDLDSIFTLGSTGPLLGSTLSAATESLKIFGILGTINDIASLKFDVSFSSLYENLVSQSSKKPVLIIDFDKENDSLKDSAGNVVRAFSKNIIERRDESITEDSILSSMWHSVSDYLDGYVKRAKSNMR
ncbi:hypothetical protein [Chryseobacterium herbae]|uniref:Uncharacterized protein n=1 Tax=Chryseobacterium herbae TaxID=2976476 RepID=A0ABT2ISF7_9FLAO|nr:hypothetical protein [Chryseobacterium sp. pc1-10]MCT2561766.1 hypothetical protein [Chryseobacterium sp. pc1-10]